MHQNSCFVDLLECCPEGGDDHCRQFVDEPDSISDENRFAIGKSDAPGRRIERREELVLCIQIGSAECIQERAFASVGVSDKCCYRHPLTRAPVSIDLAVPMHLAQLILDESNPLLRFSPVGLELGFTGPADANSTDSLTTEMCPHAG